MPISFGIGECEFFNKHLFRFKVCRHFFYWNIIVGNSRCFAVTLDTKVIELNNKGRLHRFSTLRNGKWILKWQLEYFIRNGHVYF